MDDDDDDSSGKNRHQRKSSQSKNSDAKPKQQQKQSDSDNVLDETKSILKSGHYTDSNGNKHDIAKNVSSSVDNTVTYNPSFHFDLDDFFDQRNTFTKNDKSSIYSKIEVTTESTFSAAKRFKNNNIKEVCLLNFASPFQPRDLVRQGRNQESILSRRSSLFCCLSSQTEMYDHYQQNPKTSPYYSHYLIYAPNVVVFRDDDYRLVSLFRVSIISATAVNYAEVLKKFPKGEKFGLAYKIMKERCRKIVELCISTNNRVLVLGAFGCGSSKNDPDTISKIFKEILVDEFYGMKLKNIVFAIKAPPNQKNDAYEAFKSRVCSKKDSKS